MGWTSAHAAMASAGQTPELHFYEADQAKLAWQRTRHFLALHLQG